MGQLFCQPLAYLDSGRYTYCRYWPDAKRTCDTHPPSDVVGWVLDAVAASIYPSPVTQRLDFWPFEDAFLGVTILRGALLPMGNTNQDLVRSKRLLIHGRETQRHCKPAWLLRW
ncbi:hypothetical protein CRV24_005536 [Beauveria bassiana]|nr:hypothetical protein CRV24_005536 [Beauveria bassiana]